MAISVASIPLCKRWTLHTVAQGTFGGGGQFVDREVGEFVESEEGVIQGLEPLHEWAFGFQKSA